MSQTPPDVVTFGCRLNAYESEVIRDNVAKAGRSNVTVFNTCSVTKEAERQAKQAIRRMHREHPEREIIVTGCAAQIDPEAYASIDGVTQVLGNSEKMESRNYEMGSRHTEEKILVNDIMSITETASHLITDMSNHARAFMQVQNGCDHRCTFCIIPYGRGNSRSVAVGEIVQQAQLLVQKGYNEIVLTGVDMTGYGKDLPGQPTLGQMIQRLLRLVPDLPRLRLSSIDVAEIDDELRDLIANEPRLMPHLHLSLQAGDNMILKRMKRRHNREQVIAFCDWARSVRPDMVFGADIIAGFPTETDAMFENTLNIVAEAGLTWLHVFPYSEREGTPAANIPESKHVPKPLRKERAAALRASAEPQISMLFDSLISKEVMVLMEKDGMGHTEQFAPVKLSDKLPAGSLHRVTITGQQENHLTATLTNDANVQQARAPLAASH